MIQEKFTEVLEKRIGLIRKVLGAKAAEYARSDDRLHNFKRVALVKGCTPADASIDGFCKHLVSILDMVDDLRKGVKHPMALWEEKIGDGVNYLILLEALITEDLDERKSNAG